MKSILFLGGESSGKTTLARHIAFLTPTGSYVREYGRDYYDNYGIKSIEDLYNIKNEQLIIEQKEILGPNNANDLLCIDTNIIVTEFYARKWFNQSIIDIHSNEIKEYLKSYSLIVLCENDFDFVQDGTRQNIEFSTEQNKFYRNILDDFEIHYLVVTGSVEDRTTQIIKALE